MKIQDVSEQSEEDEVPPEERKRRAKMAMNARLDRERMAPAAKGQPQAPGKFPKGRQQADEVISSDSESVSSYYEESGEEEAMDA